MVSNIVQYSAGTGLAREFQSCTHEFFVCCKGRIYTLCNAISRNMKAFIKKFVNQLGPVMRMGLA